MRLSAIIISQGRCIHRGRRTIMASVDASEVPGTGDCNDEKQIPSKNEESFSKLKIKLVKGDLFSCPKTDSLAHCVSKDLAMGKGIAKLFKDKFNGVPQLKLQGKDVGDVAVLQRENRFIYYLITKPKYFHKPTYKTLEDSLVAMKKHCVANKVTALSMPKIGCGLDKLEWPKVEESLLSVFKDTDIKITVYSI